MKIQNISIENINLDNNSAKLLFEIVDTTENVSVYLKINENDYQEIFANKTNEKLEYDLTNLPKGVNNATLKLTNATSEYITEPFLIKMVINPTVQDMVCSYSDSKGNYTLEFIFTGDTLLKYNIYLSLDNKDYKEVLNNQISGKKSIKDIDTMGTHKAVLKINDGYDDFIFEEFQFDIKNHKPQLSSVLVTDIKLDGSCQIHYGVKDYEGSQLTHRLNIDGNYISLTPTNVNYFYTYNILGLQTGKHDCFVEVSDGIDTVKTETVTVEIFSNTQNKKKQLYQAKMRYDEAYRYLKEIITSVIKDGIFDYDVENNIKQKAFDNYNMEYSNFNKIAQQSIDIIGNNKVTKAKEEINQEILDVENAMNTLEDTMNTTFKDGILSDSEKDTLNNTLNLVAKEKDDIDSDYEVLYNNEDLINTTKTNLKNAYDNFITSHNNLVLAIDGIINKTGIIDNNDKSRIDNAFSDWRNKLGAYRTASMEAIDSIAKKKADDSADIVNKRWADIILGEDGIQSQVGNLQQTISGDGGIEERLKTAEQTITTEGISNLIKDTYYSKQEVDKQLDATVAQVEVLYYLSTSIDSLVGGKWSSTTPAWEEGKYVWTKTVTTLTDGTVKESAPVCITNTIDIDLEEIKLYTWIRYADDKNGNGISNDPTGKDYIGFAYNKLSATESNTPSDYTWSLIKGTDGVPGKDGADGKTLYTWIKYSDNSNGSSMYETPNNNTKYIGIAVNKTTSTESNTPSDYTWSKFKGEDGMDGVPGKDGANGSTYYTWIKYADDSSGNGISNDPTGKTYIGFAYNKTTSTESNTKSDYTWSLIKGTDGVPGKDGTDGKTYYTWIKYSDNVDGTNMYETPNNNTKYIGIAVNKTTSTESSVKTDYTWSKFRGEDGVDGTSVRILGSYDTVAELNKAHPSNNENGDAYMVNGDLYVWTVNSFLNVGRIQGESGRGIVSITPQYYLSTSKTSQTGGSWSKNSPTWVKSKYLWVRHEIVYENPSSTEYTTPVLDGNWEGLTNLQGQIDNNKTEIETTKETVVEHTTSLNSITSRVSTTESNITKINGNITNVTNRISAAEQKITEDAITNTVKKSFYTKSEADTKINSIEIGGRNLLKNSKVNISNDTSYLLTNLYFGDEKPTEGETYTISIKGNLAQTKTSFSIYNSGGNLQVVSLYKEDSKNGIYTKTFSWKKGSTTNTFIHIYQLTSSQTGSSSIEWVKLEKGNKATDWTPAPEDVQSQIDTQVSTVEQTVNSWGVKITQNEKDISSLKLTDESFNVTIKNKADKSNIISMINASTESITISSSKVNISGFVTFSDLSTSGKTTINGSNITTGTINASKATITNINASNITTGTLDASKITVKNLSASNITTGTLDGSKATITNINATNITTGTLSGNLIQGGTIKGATFQTYADSTSKGVVIGKDMISLNGTKLIYKSSDNFRLASDQTLTLSSPKDIYLMAGLSTNESQTGTNTVIIPNATLRTQKLKVINDATIQGACAVSGAFSCASVSCVGSIAATNGFSSSNGGLVVTGSITTNSGNINANNGQVSCKTLKVSSSTSFGSLSCSSLTSSGTVTGKNVQLNTGSIWLGTGPGTVTASYVKMGTGGYMAAYSGFHFVNSAGSPHTLRAGTIYANGTSVSSDERLKTDIKYVDIDKQEITLDGLMSPNVNITTSDMHEFIETMPIASYRLIDELNENRDNTHYGFLIQDIMETKVGSELTEIPKDGYGNETDGYYTYSQDKFIAFICGALQKEIKLRKELEEKVTMLEEKINKE